MWRTDMRGPIMPTFVVLAVVLTGCKAKAPGKLETGTMTFVKHHVFIGKKNLKNPHPNNFESLADGKEAFSHYCVTCHYNDVYNTVVLFAEHISLTKPMLAFPEV